MLKCIDPLLTAPLTCRGPKHLGEPSGHLSALRSGEFCLNSPIVTVFHRLIDI